MPLGDIAGEVLGGSLRFVGRILFEVLFELLAKGVGYALIKFFRPHSEPSDVSCGLVGLVFWAAAITLGFVVYQHGIAA
jgi:hypothetical protein